MRDASLTQRRAVNDGMDSLAIMATGEQVGVPDKTDTKPLTRALPDSGRQGNVLRFAVWLYRNGEAFTMEEIKALYVSVIPRDPDATKDNRKSKCNDAVLDLLGKRWLDTEGERFIVLPSSANGLHVFPESWATVAPSAISIASVAPTEPEWWKQIMQHLIANSGEFGSAFMNYENWSALLKHHKATEKELRARLAPLKLVIRKNDKCIISEVDSNETE